MRQTTAVREQLMGAAEREITGVRAVDLVFGEGPAGAAAAADFLGYRRSHSPDPQKRAEANRARSSFLRSLQRWRASEYGTGRQSRSAGSSPQFSRLISVAQRAWIGQRARDGGITVPYVWAAISVSNDEREREIDLEVWVSPDALQGTGFFDALEKGNWHDTALALSTAWFAEYTEGVSDYEFTSWDPVTDLELRLGG